MKPQLRIFLALTLMIGVFFLSEVLFPPVRPEAPVGEGDPLVQQEDAEARPETADADADPMAVLQAAEQDAPPAADDAGLFGPGQEGTEPGAGGRPIIVETPLYRIAFGARGAAVHSVGLLEYESFTRDGPVELVPLGSTILGTTWTAGGENFDLTAYEYSASPAEGFTLQSGDAPRTLTFRYDYPGGRFFSEIRYTFTPDSYVVDVAGSLPAIERAAIFLDLGPGVAFNELREEEERRMSAVSANHLDEGITSRPIERIDEPEIMTGPLRWAAVKSKYFLEAILPAADGATGGGQLTEMRIVPASDTGRRAIGVATPVSAGGTYGYRAYLGPVERQRLIALGGDLEEVNPYGWRFLRPVIRPFVGIVLWVVRFLHEQILLPYGWVLIAMGILLRVVMWPLNRKMMMSQVKTMSVQPFAEEIKRKYGKDPQRMQQETIKLYREHGVNPLAGCLPMLIPMPVLIALFFVFQNTIEMRGVSFMWFPDLSAPDPLYVLPLLMGASLYLSQRITMKISGSAGNPQMKMMMYFLPVVFTVLFLRFPSGLNLYYTTMNIAAIPQQILIGKERKRMQAAHTVKRPA